MREMIKERKICLFLILTHKLLSLSYMLLEALVLQGLWKTFLLPQMGLSIWIHCLSTDSILMISYFNICNLNPSAIKFQLLERGIILWLIPFLELYYTCFHQYNKLIWKNPIKQKKQLTKPYLTTLLCCEGSKWKRK